MRHRQVWAGCLAVLLSSVPLLAQPESREPGTTSLLLGLGGASTADVAAGTVTQRAGVAATMAVSLRLSSFALLRVEALAAAPALGDFLDIVASPFNADTANGTYGSQKIRARGPQSSMLGFAPAIELEPFMSIPLRLRAGPAWLRSSHVDGSTGSPSNPSSIDYIRSTASGLGWRVGVSTPLGKADSRVLLSADVMRARTSIGPIYLVPVALSFRIF
jgi:hypothetical protein